MKSILKVLITIVFAVTFVGCPVVTTGQYVIYNGNGSTGGAVPIDTNEYEHNDVITVLDDTGTLIKPESTFSGWNTKSDGSGETYDAEETLLMGNQDITLYAIWTPEGSVRAVAAGSSFSYILKNDGSLWVTGLNGAGQLGDGTTASRSSTHKIMDDVKAISVSRQNHAMILKENGNLYGVGDKSQGKLGLEDTIISTPTPILVKSGIASVSCGYYHTMAIDTNGVLWAAGSNGISGILGNGSEEASYEFIQIDTDVSAVSAGERHTLYVKEGNLYAMGDSTSGKLGRPYSSSNTYDRTPQQVSGISDVRSVSAGMNHSLVITNSNELYSFGRQENGQLLNSVDSDTEIISTPTKVRDNVKQAEAGENVSMIITTTGEVLVAGYNTYGMLGDGTATIRQTYVTPLEVRTGVESCSLGSGHSLIIDDDGTVYGAGSNASGQLGQGSTDSVNHYAFLEIPVEIVP
ncbi:MAG: hypothetical protein EOM67_05835 [Spirochaetia bacterium]|nr:hypothetical protein [Spirochaetia bacterium]